jgi:hypothetical protein
MGNQAPCLDLDARIIRMLGDKVPAVIAKQLVQRGVGVDSRSSRNPESPKEGAAMADLTRLGRIAEEAVDRQPRVPASRP